MELFDQQFQALNELLNWRVTLDIVLIAMGIFFLYHTLRTTGTWKIVLGIVLAAFVFITARILDLQGIEWIYSNLSPILLIAMIIIFQPELRKIFERVASFQPQEAVRETTKLSHLLGDVLVKLAQQRRGAIVVIPGKDSIKPWTSEGIALDANPSFPLLMSLFDPHSPGHDGAVVLERGKIVSFAVRLPASQRTKLSQEFGTRHHAAMALAENTDALILAVSEERGTVTMFAHGEHRRVENKNEIAAAVTEHLKTTASFELPGFDQKNRRMLITELAVSLLLAFLFWSTVVLTHGAK